MAVKKYSMVNVLTAAIFASLLIFSTIAVAAPAKADSPGNSGSQRPDNPPNRPATSPGQDDKD